MRRAPMVPTGSVGMVLFPAWQPLPTFTQRNRRAAGVLSLGIDAICALVVVLASACLLPVALAMRVEINPWGTVEPPPCPVAIAVSEGGLLITAGIAHPGEIGSHKIKAFT